MTASFWTFGAIAMAELLLKLEISRGYLAVALPAGILGLVLSRLMWRSYVARRRVEGRYQTAVLAIGESAAVAESRERADRQPEEWISGRGGWHIRLWPSTWRTPRSQRPGDPHHWWRNPRVAGDPYLRCRHSRDCRHGTLRLSRESAGLFGSSSRWTLTLWCRLESWMSRSLG